MIQQITATPDCNTENWDSIFANSNIHCGLNLKGHSTIFMHEGQFTSTTQPKTFKHSGVALEEFFFFVAEIIPNNVISVIYAWAWSLFFKVNLRYKLGSWHMEDVGVYQVGIVY